MSSANIDTDNKTYDVFQFLEEHRVQITADCFPRRFAPIRTKALGNKLEVLLQVFPGPGDTYIPPRQWINGDPLSGENIVLWYVPLLKTKKGGPYWCQPDPEPAYSPCDSILRAAAPRNEALILLASADSPAAALEIDRQLLAYSFSRLDQHLLGEAPASVTWSYTYAIQLLLLFRIGLTQE